MSTGGESIFRGEGITVEDEFTNDTFDDEEEGGEGWLEDGDEVRECFNCPDVFFPKICIPQIRGLYSSLLR